MDSTTASGVPGIIPSWLPEVFTTAIFAGLVGVLLWFLQYQLAKRHKKEEERKQIARVWGLALFELREAIDRSLTYFTKFSKGTLSLGVLYFSNTIASDYFKMHSNLTVASDMHWMYSILNQIQQNLHTSRITDEVTRNKNKGDPLTYASAASGFAKDYKYDLISKFNTCLKKWRDFCNKHNIPIDIELEMLEQSSKGNQEARESG